MQTIDVHCEQLNIEVSMPFSPNDSAHEFTQKVMQNWKIPAGTSATLYANQNIVNPNKKISELGNGLSIRFHQIVEITATNKINQLTLKIDLWGKIKEIEQSILQSLNCNNNYSVVLSKDDYELESEDLCMQCEINSKISYRVLVSFLVSTGKEIQNLQIDVYTTIAELMELVAQLFEIQDFQLEYEGTILQNSDQITLFSYSIKPGNTINVRQSMLTILLCNQAHFADEREIQVRSSDQIKILDGVLQDPHIQIQYQYAGVNLDSNQTFANQKIPDYAKIRYLISIQSQQIKIFFEDLFTNQLSESLVQQDEQIYREVSKILRMPKSQINQLYEITLNQEPINIDDTYRSIGASFGSTIVFCYRSIEIELYYQTKRYSLSFPSEATVGQVLQQVEEKFKITNSELFQNDERLALDTMLKEVYKKPFNLIESDKQAESFHQTKEILLYIQPQNIDILITVNSDDTVKDLLNKLRRDQGFPLNQPMILRSIQGAEIPERDQVEDYRELKVEVFDYLHIVFMNLRTKIPHQDIVDFEDTIKNFAQSRGLGGCVFFHNNKKLNLNESFKQNMVFNNDTISFDEEQSLVIKFKYKKKESNKFEPEVTVEIKNLEQKVEDFQKFLADKFNLDEIILYYDAKPLPNQLTINECKIANNATIVATNLILDIRIKDLKQNTQFNVYVRPSQRIRDLQEMLTKRVKSQQITLIHEGRVISDQQTLRQIGIVDQSVIEINY